jgi:hypothetical protein
MPKKRLLEVMKHKPKARGPGAPKGNNNALKGGAFSGLTNLDQRCKLARSMRDAEHRFRTALGGDPSPQEQTIVNRIVFKIAKCSLYEAAALAGQTSSDNQYLAWANSLRLDLQALGLERRAVKVMDLDEYLQANRDDSDEGEKSSEGQEVQKWEQQ